MTWKQLIEEEMKRRKETWNDILSCAAEVDCPKMGCRITRVLPDWVSIPADQEVPFCVWTLRYVYIPAEDPSPPDYRVVSVPRDPCQEAVII